jgi:transcriptional regulator with XRE-family HTH domain
MKEKKNVIGDFRKRITELRVQKNVSEYQMSLGMGHNRGYIQNIVSGKTLPSMKEFFTMCDYLGVEPKYFFDIELENPALVKIAFDKIRTLSEDGLMVIISILNMITDKNAK